MPVANSIDEFMDQHKDDEEVQLCGKLAIVKSILIAERRSKLYVDWRAPYAGARRFEQALDSWFVRFFKIASKGIAKANANQALDNIFVINFNYDRCLEVFLRDALFALYRMDNDVADRILDQRVLHPYGRIGSLPSGSVMDPLPFGADEDWVTNLSRLSKGIHTFTEQIGDAQVVGRIREEISKAKVIIFLGFGFHRQNMDLLTSGTRSVVRRIYATSYGMSDPDRNLVQNQLKERLSNPSVTLRIEMPNNLTCKQLFDDYQRSLSN